MKEFDKKFSKYIKTVSIGQYDNSGVNVGFLAAKDVILKWHTDVTRKLIEAVGEELIEQTLSYEDSGITPEQLATFQRFNLKEIINSLK